VFLNGVLREICFVSKAEEVGEEWRISEGKMGGKCSMYVRDGT
jgi:hypothetical protein